MELVQSLSQGAVRGGGGGGRTGGGIAQLLHRLVQVFVGPLLVFNGEDVGIGAPEGLGVFLSALDVVEMPDRLPRVVERHRLLLQRVDHLNRERVVCVWVEWR